MPVAAAATARAQPRRPVQKAAAALRWLYLLGADVVVYGFLAALWVGNVGGVALEILGRWVWGEGSAVSAAGRDVLVGSNFVMLRLLPGFVMLSMIRVSKRAEFDAKEEKEKLASSSPNMVESALGQPPERNGARRLQLPKGVKLAPLYMVGPLVKLLCLGIRMHVFHGKGSLGWKIGSVLVDLAHLGLAVLIGFVTVPNMVIL